MAISAALGVILLLAAGNGFRLDGETVLISCCLKKNEKAVAIVHSESVATAFLSQSPCFLYFFDFGLADNMNKWLIDCERWAGWRNGLAKRRTILYN